MTNFNTGCFVEAIMESNGKTPDSLTGYLMQVKSAEAIEQSISTLGSAALTEVTCDRCDMTFQLEETPDGEKAAVHLDTATQDRKKCVMYGLRDAPIGSRPLLNINLSRLKQNVRD